MCAKLEARLAIRSLKLFGFWRLCSRPPFCGKSCNLPLVLCPLYPRLANTRPLFKIRDPRDSNSRGASSNSVQLCQQLLPNGTTAAPSALLFQLPVIPDQP